MKFISLLNYALIATMVGAATIPLPARVEPDINTRMELTKRIDIVAKTDEILFQYSIDAFTTAKAQKNPPELKWDNGDGCTRAPDSIPGLFNFLPSCQRHDFGFLNYGNQTRLCPSSRNKLDQQFYRDMNDHCSKRHSRWYQYLQRRACRKSADAYLYFVQQYHPTYSSGC